MTGVKCDKCGGTGRGPREGEEANPTLHPQLASIQGVCWSCGGSGELSVEETKKRAQAATKMETVP